MSLFDSLQTRAEVLLSAEEYLEHKDSPPYPEVPYFLTHLTTDQKYSGNKKKTAYGLNIEKPFYGHFTLSNTSQLLLM